MDTSLDYYLTNGDIRIGKKELTFELLRKDSILNALLPTGLNINDYQEDQVMIQLKDMELKMGEDPTKMLNELKQRYGDKIGGKLDYKLIYTFKNNISYLYADLDDKEITLKLKG